jgi:toxin ParE1/3/4
MKISWSPQAREDIRQIFVYYQALNPAAAEKLIDAIVSAALLLEDYPHLGRGAEDGKIRFWQVPRLPYLLPYRIVENEIEISAVFDERQKRPDDWR